MFEFPLPPSACMVSCEAALSDGRIMEARVQEKVQVSTLVLCVALACNSAHDLHRPAAPLRKLFARASQPRCFVPCLLTCFAWSWAPCRPVLK